MLSAFTLSARSRRNTKRAMPRISLGGKVLHIFPIPCRRLRSGPQFSASLLDQLDVLTLTRCPEELALDLLRSCGYHAKIRAGFACRMGSTKPCQRLCHCKRIEGFAGAFLPFEPPQNTKGVFVTLPVENHFPWVNLFGGTLRLNERLRCPDPFIKWAASR